MKKRRPKGSVPARLRRAAAAQDELLRSTPSDLSAQLDRYTQLFDFAPIGYATVGKDGNIHELNHVGAALLGDTRPRCVGKSFEMFVASADRSKYREALHGVLANNRKAACEVQLVRGHDKLPTVHLTASSLAAREATVLIAFEDVTIQKNAVERLQRAYEELREAHRRKDLFLAVLSHELRTPLSALLMHGQLLQESGLDQEGIRRSGRVIERAAKAQSRLIEDLLDVSRIVAGKLSLRNDDVNVAMTVHGAIDAVAEEARRKNIQLTINVDPTTPLVKGDNTRLQQAVWNLLTNAIKFTPENGQVRVTLDEVDAQVRIEVCDSGMGIDPEFLPHIFVRFAQADRSPTQSTGGLGLGLSIANSIVKAHGGSIRVESGGRGRGSVFTIFLPAARAVKGAQVS